MLGQRSGELASPWQLQKKSPCRRAAYDPTLVANLAIALLTVHHGNNPAIPCDPHNAGKRRGHMTSCLLLDSEVEGSIRSMNGDFKASRRGECIYRQAGGKVGSSAVGASRIKSRVALKEL